MAAIVIAAAKAGDVRAAQWWLERRAAADYGRALTLTAHVDPITVEHVAGSWKQALHERLERLCPDQEGRDSA